MQTPTALATPSPPRLLAIIELQNAIAAAGLNADEVMNVVADRAATLLAAGVAIIALVEGDDFGVRAVVGSGAVPAVGSRVPRGPSLAGRCIAEGKAMRIEAPVDHEAPLRGQAGVASVACVPLVYGESAVGVIEVASARASAFSDEDVETLRLLGHVVAIALHRAYTYPRPRYDNLQDALTGLGNRRAFDERLDAELNRHRRFHHSFILALVKLSGLEAAVDRLGQVAGDDMLCKVAGVLRQHTRMIDGCFRITADELAIVMPGTALEGARIVAERCREHARESRILDAAVRVGCGVVAAEATESIDDIVHRASAGLHADLT